MGTEHTFNLECFDFLLCTKATMRVPIMNSGRMMSDENSGIVSLGTVNDHS